MYGADKNHLVVRISRETKIPQTRACRILELAFDLISNSLLRGQKVELRNFGVFSVVNRKPRIGRNPSKPAKRLLIPACVAVRFKAGKKMKSGLKKLKPAAKRQKRRRPTTGNRRRTKSR